MNISTSYFAKYHEPNGVSIARSSPPTGFTGTSFRLLAPPWALLRQYQRDQDEEGEGAEEAYIKAYREQVLNKLNPVAVAAQLDGKVLLCWEGPGKFCHRYLVAAWLEATVGIKVEEV